MHNPASDTAPSRRSVFAHPADAYPVVTLIVFLVFQAAVYLRALPGWWWLIPLLVAGRWAHLVLHVHAHRGLFARASWNRGFDAVLTIATGMPPPLYREHHVETHHRFNNRPDDWTGPFSFKAARFPDRPVNVVVYVVTFIPRAWTRSLRSIASGSRDVILQVRVCMICMAVSIGAAAWHDPTMASTALVGPWLVLFWGSAIANWRHHRGCTYEDERSAANDAIGPLSRRFGFNIGYHTAHHVEPAAHWTTLPSIHQQLVASSGGGARVP